MTFAATIPSQIAAPLPAAGTSAVWKYKAIYLLNGEPVGQWSNVASISVKGGVIVAGESEGFFQLSEMY